jgi:hypothetical protein
MATAAPRQAPPPIQVAGCGRRERARTNAASSHGTARLAGETVRWRPTASEDSPAAASATAAAHRGRPTRRASSHSRPRPATVATTISSRPPATAFGARPAAPVSRSQAARWAVASVGATPENVRAASGTPRVAAHAADTSAPSSPAPCGRAGRGRGLQGPGGDRGQRHPRRRPAVADGPVVHPTHRPRPPTRATARPRLGGRGTATGGPTRRPCGHVDESGCQASDLGREENGRVPSCSERSPDRMTTGGDFSEPVQAGVRRRVSPAIRLRRWRRPRRPWRRGRPVRP